MTLTFAGPWTGLVPGLPRSVDGYGNSPRQPLPFVLGKWLGQSRCADGERFPGAPNGMRRDL